MIVFLLAAITADGYIGRSDTDRSFDWTSVEDKKFYVDSIKRARAIVMGAKTFATFTRYPRGSKYVIYTHHPEDFSNPKPDVIEAEYTKESPEIIIQKLKDENYSEVAICGGSSIYSMFLKAGLINKIYLTVEPKLFGKGVPLFNENLEVNLRLVRTENLSDQTVLLEYDVLADGAQNS